MRHLTALLALGLLSTSALAAAPTTAVQCAGDPAICARVSITVADVTPPPVPVDAVCKDNGWTNVGGPVPAACPASGQQTQTQENTWSTVQPPQNNGKACPTAPWPTRQVPVTCTPPPPVITWTKAAGENQTFTLVKSALVRYGTGTRWTAPRLMQAGTIQCNNATFTDPVVGSGKECQVSDATAIGPPVPPQPPSGGPIPAIWAPTIYRDVRIAASSDRGAASDIGAFRNPGPATHMLFDDPIKFPGVVGGSHLHVYFVNPTLTANSTLASLQAANASSAPGGIVQESSYWVPAMVDTATNNALIPGENLIYYKSGYNGIPLATIEPVPLDLQIIAGNYMTTTGEVGDAHHNFECWHASLPQGRSGMTQHIPACPVGGYILSMFMFPNCWNGQLRATDFEKRNNMAYSGGGTCPASHPRAIASITLNIKYWVGAGQDTRLWRLSSDMYPMFRPDGSRWPGGYSMHADGWVVWDTATAKAWNDNCVRARKDCHGYLLGDGRTTF